MASAAQTNPRFSFGKTVNDMFLAIGRHFLLMAILAIAFSGLPSAIYLVGVFQMTGSAMTGGYFDMANWFGTLGIIVFVGWIATLLFGVFAQAAVTEVGLRGVMNESSSFGEATAVALRCFLTLVGITLIYYILALIVAAFPVMAILALTGVSLREGMMEPAQIASAGISIFLLFVFVIAPILLFFVVVWIAAVPAAIQERLGPIAALVRSWQLTSGHRWKLLAMVLIYFFALILIGMALNMVALAVIGFGSPTASGDPFSGIALANVLQSFLGSLLLVITYPALAATYVNLRIAKEGAPSEQVSDIFE